VKPGKTNREDIPIKHTGTHRESSERELAKSKDKEASSLRIIDYQESSRALYRVENVH
jgi:hypothetical protein